ncbi:winged helix-turn-helix transcriptional regulator [Clostridium sp. Marseille-Q7071]
MKSYLTKISHKSLTHQLRELEEDGLVKRVILPEVPPRVGYSLTEKGKTIFSILQLMCQ